MDTVNPPGNETRAAEVLAEYLQRDGLPSELIARVPERANLVARIPGGDGPSLAFLSHTDTVLADPAEWDRDPWSGDLVDGEIWGRGALDMKGQVAASAVASPRSRERASRRPAISCFSSRGRGGGRRASGSAGSWRRIPTRRAATTPSTRAAATGSCSAGGPSTCARPRRRCRRRSASACTAARSRRPRAIDRRGRRPDGTQSRRGRARRVSATEVRPLEPDDAAACDAIVAGLPYHFGQEQGRRDVRGRRPARSRSRRRRGREVAGFLTYVAPLRRGRGDHVDGGPRRSTTPRHRPRADRPAHRRPGGGGPSDPARAHGLAERSGPEPDDGYQSTRAFYRSTGFVLARTCLASGTAATPPCCSSGAGSALTARIRRTASPCRPSPGRPGRAR